MNWSPLALRRQIREMRVREAEMAENNPFLASAMEAEKMEGHRFAVLARTGALIVVMFMLPILNPNWNVLFYEATVLLFIALGWLQYRVARVGQSRTELLLIMLDYILLTLIFILPNPFTDEEFPTATLYNFNNFSYFYLILAVGTLAYSWRTVWSMGTFVALVWSIGAVGVYLFGHTIPELDEAAKTAFEGYDLVLSQHLPNQVDFALRLQEVVLFVIVAITLAIKGYRSNRLLMQQAGIAEERANLSRYFPSSLVDSLASTNHEVGAVKSEEIVVLFTDIVGFTRYAERTDPEEVMELLRKYNELVERAVFDNGGTLEKYIGDGVMATFGRPARGSHDAHNAVSAALQILTENDQLNRERNSAGLEPVTISVGVHYGPVIMGDIGPERRMEFAVIGDTVNVAARLESESRELKCRCVISDDVIREMRIEKDAGSGDPTVSFEDRGEVRLRGRSKPIHVWAA